MFNPLHQFTAMTTFATITDVLNNGIHYLYLVCACIGGLIMVVQFAMMCLGMGDFDDVDVPDDAPDVDLDGGDVDADAGTDSAISLARFLSFRVIVAASAFFGVIGLWAESAKTSSILGFILAVIGGGVAGVAVASIMGFINKLQSSGNVKVESAIGKEATVYISIPGHKSNTGKIQLSMQGRIEELEAMTTGEALPSGTTVIVKELIDGRIAIVEKE